MKEIKETNDFNEYLEQNPRRIIPSKEMKTFLDYAISRYQDWGIVNHTHLESEPEEIPDEVKEYIGNSMEALLLYREWIKERADNKC